MLNYLQYLNVPGWVALIVVAFFLLVECCKGASTLWGLIAPKIFKVKTEYSRKKEIDQIIIDNQEEIKELKKMQDKDRELSKQADKEIKEDVNDLKTSLADCTDAITQMRLDQMRQTILDFSSGSAKRLYTKEHFMEVFSIYDEYHALLEKNGLTNGKTDVSIEIIKSKFKWCVENGGFLEDQIEYMKKEREE